jgi:spore coat polysaccharide biosynthesis predicted glycosyltransferase SpsG/L-amino acid N-acyltransferase YncA
MNVYILTEAGQKVGFGHLSRCTAVYEAFRQKGIKPLIIVNGDHGVSHFLKGINHEVIDWHAEFQELLSRIAGVDIVFIDSYLTDKPKYDDIASVVNLVACIDDYKRIIYPAGVVINGLIYAPQLSYPKITGVKYLLGAKYAILRKAFWSAPVKKFSADIKKVFITFGGSDFLNLAPDTVRLMAEKYPLWKKCVVVSRFYKNKDAILKAGDKNTEIVFDASDRQMKQLMNNSDVAISASGQTLSELAVMGVPGVAVCVADNQRHNWNAWTKAGFGRARPQAEDILKTLEGLSSLKVRAGISGRLQKSISPSGVIRIAQDLIRQSNENTRDRKKREASVSLRNVNKKDCRDIWLWRNSRQARSGSFQSEPIAYADHVAWFERKSRDPQSVLWMAVSGVHKIGHVRFDKQGQTAVISIVLNPQYLGLGFGSRILRVASRKFLRMNKTVTHIAAEIQDHNKASIGAFTSAGYQFHERIMKNGKKAGMYLCVQ